MKKKSLKEKRQDYLEMRTLRSAGWKLKDISAKTGYTIGSVSRICNYQTEVH